MNDLTHANIEANSVPSTEVIIPVTKEPQVAPKAQAEKAAAKQRAMAKMTQPKAQTSRTPLAADAVAKRSFLLLDDNKVKAEYTFRVDEKSKDRYPIVTVFDFGNCSREDILFLAASSVRITVQGKLRSMGNSALDASTYATVDVKSEVCEAQKSQVDETIRGIRALARATGVSEARAREIIEAELAKTKR